MRELKKETSNEDKHYKVSDSFNKTNLFIIQNALLVLVVDFTIKRILSYLSTSPK